MTRLEAAAFLDRVGSFEAERQKNVLITARHQDREELQKLVRLFGGDISGPSHGLLEWRLEGEPARKTMQSLHDLMSPRRQAEINHALEIYRAHCHWLPLENPRGSKERG
jgi:hypothetical protein